ncbi:hypothetical protein ACJX0J_024794, partial [Zea mays]
MRYNSFFTQINKKINKNQALVLVPFSCHIKKTVTRKGHVIGQPYAGNVPKNMEYIATSKNGGTNLVPHQRGTGGRPPPRQIGDKLWKCDRGVVKIIFINCYERLKYVNWLLGKFHKIQLLGNVSLCFS